MLLKQKKSTIKPPFDPSPYEVTKSKNNIITMERKGRTFTRHASQVKKVHKRPAHLIREKDRKETSAAENNHESSDIEFSDLENGEAENVEEPSENETETRSYVENEENHE